MQVVGVLHVHRDGFGFVEPLGGKEEDVYLPRREAQRAVDGDLVRVELQPRRGRTEGRLLKILERRRQSAVGTYFERGKNAYVVPRRAGSPGTTYAFFARSK